jgi:lauroyl/myristoyl acyltransferase
MAGLRWKTPFYGAALPALRRLGRESADGALVALGGAVERLWWPWSARLTCARRRAQDALGRPLPLGFRRTLGAQAARAAARDLLLEDLGDRDLAARFVVDGFGHAAAAMARGRGLIVVGAHFGAHVPALHWLARRLPLRAMIQRPSHVSRRLLDALTSADGPHPQADFLLRRDMGRDEAVAAMMRARAALRDGLAIYLCGDVPWPTGREVGWMGRRWRLLDHWAQLAAATGAAVVPLVATYQPGGGHRLRFGVARRIRPDGVDPAVAWFLDRLEHAVRAEPEQAVPYWLWPSYQPPAHPAPAHPGTPHTVPRRATPHDAVAGPRVE